jgi:D-alanyl-D-alanine carboxypeptidase
MFKLSAICVASLILLQTPYSAAQSAPVAATAQSLAERIDTAIGGYYKATDPGITVLVAQDGKPLLRKAYGMASVDKKQALTADHALRLGSITKQFTSTAILMLAEEGKLAVSDDITKHLPDYPTKGKKITIEHLLTHTSGIVSYTSKPGFSGTLEKDFTVAQMIDGFKNDPLEFEPGTRYAYNNSGYFLLGAIIEKVSDMSYAKFVEQRIFIPLKMDHTAYEVFERKGGPRAEGHQRSEKGGFGPSVKISMSQPYAAGALVSTVDDLNRWDQAIASGRLLKAASWQQAFTPYKLASGVATEYGYGWSVGTLHGSPTIGHGGGIPGFSTFALRLPQEKIYVAVLGNTGSGNVEPATVAYKAAALAMGKPFPEFKPIALDAAALDAFTGVYQQDETTSRTVRRDGDKLVVQRNGRGALALQAHSANGFHAEQSLVQIEFGRDAKGAVNQMTLHQNGSATVIPRSGALPAGPAVVKVAPDVLDRYVGRYQLAPGFVIEISRDGDKFMAQATNQPKIELFASSETAFFMKVVEAKVNFTRNPDGGHTLVLNQNGRSMPATLVK